MSYMEIKIPAMGEGIIEATVIRWICQEGEQVHKDDVLAEIATDKVDSEIFSPVEGKLHKILRKEGEIPRVGEIIALIWTGEGEPGVMEHQSTEFEEEKHGNISTDPLSSPTNTENIATNSLQSDSLKTISARKILQNTSQLSPFVKKVAEDLGFDLEEIAKIRGTAVGGRISKKDLYRYLQGKEKMELPENIQQQLTQETNTPVYQGEANRIPMDRVRSLIAAHMMKSVKTSPHVTSFHEADFTLLVNWRNRIKEEFFQKYSTKLTYTPVFIMAICHAIKKFPRINSSLEAEIIIEKKDIHIGVATALPDGNLIVPVIRNADTLNLEGLATTLNDLTIRARKGKLQPSEIGGGTFTITNLGMFGSLTGTPIINQPESAILAIGAIQRKPGVVQTSFGESIGIRDLCMLSMSYDHRIIDGALGGMFLKEVANYLENPPFLEIHQESEPHKKPLS